MRNKSLILSIWLRNTTLLFCVFLENDTRIMTTESKSIGQSYVHFALLCFVEREVQVIVDVFVVITLFVVDGRRNNAILDGEDACNGFYRTGSAQQVLVMDFVELMFNSYACCPNTSLIAFASEISPTGVDVP